MEAPPSLEHRLATLLAGYLTQVHAETNLPPALTIGIGLEMGQRTRPCVVCHIDTLEFPHSKLAQAECQIILFTHADETPVLQEALWVAVLRTALSNAGAFFAWLGTLPEDQRIAVWESGAWVFYRIISWSPLSASTVAQIGDKL